MAGVEERRRVYVCGEVGRGHILWKNSGKLESRDVNQSECEISTRNRWKVSELLGGFVFHSSQRSALMSCRCGTVVNYQQLETTDHSGGAENLQPQRDVLDRSSESESEDVSFFSGFSFLVFLPHRPAFHRFVVGGNNVKIHGPSSLPRGSG